MGWTIGVDVGGTFTDFYAFEADSGAVRVHKTPSTPDNPARAVIDGVNAMAARHGIDLGQVARLSHGTTVATNALIQGKGGRLALVTTAGFRDLLEIGRQIRPHMFDLQKDHPPPLVPRQRRLEAAERVTADGAVRTALGQDEIDRLVAAVRASGAEGCAICFLFSFLNPAHERLLRDALTAALPDLHVTISSDVQPEFREYERLSTTVLNAYLQPVMATYLHDFESALGAAAPRAALGINQSAGGLMSPERARELPVRTALSGPAAGAVGAIHIAGRAGARDVITLDMGGTSADVCLIRDGAADMTYERWIEGYPTRLASIDINAVGAGGGSIAWFDRDGLLKVGPVSAGAAPGPACYGAGGGEPTVTDANLVLGRLSPKGLLGGGMPMDLAAARRAFEPLAERLAMPVERTAHGVIGIVVANMVRALRAISVERGHDPRDFALLAFGGAGPLHAADVARALGIARFIVPPAPGILCAQGLVVSDLRESFVLSRLTRVGAAGIDAIRGMLTELGDRAETWFAGQAAAEDARERQVRLDMRYVGQNYELAVEMDAAAALAADADDLRRRFFAVHDRSYGFHNPDDPVEIVNVRLTAVVRLRHADPPVTAGEPGASPAPFERRDVRFAADTATATPVFDRAVLTPGHRVDGPAIVDQLDTTTLLFPGDRLAVDAAGNLIVEIGE